jgi:hypothetical protein
MSIHIYIYIYVYIYIYIYLYELIYTYVGFLYWSRCVYMYGRLQIFIYILYICMYIFAHIFISVYILICLFLYLFRVLVLVQTYVHVRTATLVSTVGCLYADICNPLVCIFICITYMHICNYLHM